MLSILVSPIQIVKQAVVSLTVQASITQTVSSLSCMHVVYELLQCVHIVLLSLHPHAFFELLCFHLERDVQCPHVSLFILLERKVIMLLWPLFRGHVLCQ